MDSNFQSKGWPTVFGWNTLTCVVRLRSHGNLGNNQRRGSMRYLALALAVCLSMSARAQNTSSTTYSEQIAEYGFCSVLNQVDMFTDEVTYVLRCEEREMTDRSEISFLVFEGSGAFVIALSKGTQFTRRDAVDILIGVNQGPLRRGRWDYDYDIDRAMLMGDLEMFNALLAEISAGGRIAIRVGDEGGNIRINRGDEAVADFIERIAHISLVAL